MTTQLTIFYDGVCPLCVAEMKRLAKLDKKLQLQFVDVQQPEALQAFSRISKSASLERLHGINQDGEVLQGLDVTYEAWRLVGKGWLVAPLRWPVLSWFADKAYLWFAKHRYRISGLLTGKSRCEQCELK